MKTKVKRRVRVHVLHFPLEFKKLGKYPIPRYNHEITQDIEMKIPLIVGNCTQIPGNTPKAEES